ncbi:hypothetical protein [Pseudoalteromonas phenolica]|uniref:hypothetical protein n=1 Tax=Pseudoalteromonas phenolica TaxID=161398 RepID=UPI00110A1F49|nr:hypothetical protein [Pseudoalteromonas phenolica]TMO54235.1 hypothetical protein CWC21_16125 [Pseudoalteromonas phenolica]
MIFQVGFYSSLIGIYTRQSLRSMVFPYKSGDNIVEIPIKRCQIGSSERTFLIVTRFLLSPLGKKPSAAIKARSERVKLEQQRVTGPLRNYIF